MAAASNTVRSLALVAFGALVAACDRGATPTPPETIAKGAPPLAEKAFYRVDAKPITPCKAGATCEAELVLTALGDYHVNDDYPTKFVADAASEVAIQGEGTFKIPAAKQGTMTVRFTPAKVGPAKLVGTFRLSVCNEEDCQIESPKITLDVTSS
ncbi:MAG TPA: hypothetical protein VIV11_42030 [Kofleriaceae bacterium]